MKPSTLHVDSFAVCPPRRSEDTALDQAMLRAYSVERSVDYGAALEDVLKLRRWVEAGHEWVGTSLLLADDNEKRALSADHNHEPLNAIRYYAYAAACCRLAQAAMETEVQNRTVIYERQAMHFKRALSGTDPSRALSFNILHNDKPHAAWLFRPASLRAAVSFGTPSPASGLVRTKTALPRAAASVPAWAITPRPKWTLAGKWKVNASMVFEVPLVWQWRAASDRPQSRAGEKAWCASRATPP